MPISQLMILSQRGDRLAFKQYRSDVPRSTDDMLFKKYGCWDGAMSQAPPGDCPPFFTERGVHFCVVRRRHLFFVCTTRENVSPNTLVEVLLRIVAVIQDFLGVLSEESIRRNFSLVYELWDEMVDYGIPQELDTERLRPYVHHDVVAVSDCEAPTETLLDRLKRAELTERVKRSDAAATSVLQRGDSDRNEVFVDLLERVSVVFGADGSPLAAQVDGSLHIKSFLKGTPTLYLGLHSGVAVRESTHPSEARGASVLLDSICFHELCNHSRFDAERLVVVQPPVGETCLLNYRVSASIQFPFQLRAALDVRAAHRGELSLRVRSDFSPRATAVGTRVRVPLPPQTTGATVELAPGATDQSFEYRAAEHEVDWVVPRFSGGMEHACRVCFTTADPMTPAMQRQVGPLSLLFEVPQHSVSGMRVDSLRIEERSSAYRPERWIRCVAQGDSYVFRLH